MSLELTARWCIWSIATIVKTRSAMQCRQYWLYCGFKILLSEEVIDKIASWGNTDDLKLIECMKEQRVDDHDEIDWFKLVQCFRHLIVDHEKKRLKDILNELVDVLESSEMGFKENIYQIKCMTIASIVNETAIRRRRVSRGSMDVSHVMDSKVALIESVQNGVYSTVNSPRRVKKHKRRLLNDIESIGTSDDISKKKTKFKRLDDSKNLRQDGNELWEDNLDISNNRKRHLSTEDLNLFQKKKSKNKRTHESVGEDFETLEDTEATVEEGVTSCDDGNFVSPTSKKKKKKKSSEALEDLECDNGNFVSLTSKKKKKKNKKFEALEDLEYDISNVSPELHKPNKIMQEFSEDDSIHRKTKKKHKQSFISPEINTDSKKKSKHKHTQESDGGELSDTGKKHHSTEDFKTPEATVNDGEKPCDVGNFVLSTSKKTKKKKSSEALEELECVISNVSPELRKQNVVMYEFSEDDSVLHRKEKKKNVQSLISPEIRKKTRKQRKHSSPNIGLSTDDQSDINLTKKKTKRRSTKRENKERVETTNEDDASSKFDRRKKKSIHGLDELKSRIVEITNRLSEDSDYSSISLKNNRKEITKNSDTDLEDCISQDLFSQSTEVERRSNVGSGESRTNDHIEIVPEPDDSLGSSNNTLSNESKDDSNKSKRKWINKSDNQLAKEKPLETLCIRVDDVPLLHTRPLKAPPDEIRRLRAQGITIKQGLWSLDEVLKLKSNWKKLNMTYKGYNMRELLFSKCHRELKRKLVQYLGQGLSTRVLVAVCRKAKTLFRDNVEGKYSKNEKKKVEELVKVHGNKWESIGICLERNGTSVRDLVRKTVTSKTQCYGPWSDDEIERLTAAIRDFTGEDDFRADCKRVYAGLPWQSIARVVKTRSCMQCRQYWLHCGFRILLSENEIERMKKWDNADSLKLIECMKEQQVDDHDEIDWFKIAQQFGSMNYHFFRTKFIKIRQLLIDYKERRLKDVLNEFSNVFEGATENVKIDDYFDV
uniref:Myb-like domain-containing protein n=1 Tax=Strigamia maritima TaxID=126957 RepID=T1JNI8_STRMM